MEPFRHVEIGQFFIPIIATCFDVSANLFLYSFFPQPHYEPSEGILFWQPGRSKHNSKQGKANATACACTERPGGCVKATITTRLNRQFLEVVTNFLGQVCYASRRRTVIKSGV